ncbi:MAG: hypothetical protein IPN74_15100 [Haliscomenobacter sp.]|nr:hypothetical protein [Haliscomenobacter sp.]
MGKINLLVSLSFWIGLLWMQPVHSQSYAFGLKGGLTIATQKWDNSFQRDPLFRQHAILFIESVEEDQPFALFAQGGYHVKGSAIRTYRSVYTQPDGSMVEVPSFTTPFVFNNLSLTLGAKQKFPFTGQKKLYYLFGIRGDYTVSTKLRPDNLANNYLFSIYPFEEFVNEFNYGATVGGGIELPFTELVGLVLELTVNPDFTKQYNQPIIRNVINPNPFGGSNLIDIPERQIVNTTFEVTLGFRFINKIVYID